MFTYSFKVITESSWNRLTIPAGSIVNQIWDDTYAFEGLNVEIESHHLIEVGQVRMTKQLATLLYQHVHKFAPSNDIWFNFFYHKQKRDAEFFLHPPTPISTKFVPDGRIQLEYGLYQLPSDSDYFVGYVRSTHPKLAFNRIDKYAQLHF